MDWMKDDAKKMDAIDWKQPCGSSGVPATLAVLPCCSQTQVEPVDSAPVESAQVAVEPAPVDVELAQV